MLLFSFELQDSLRAIKGGRIPPPGSMPSFEDMKEILGFNIYYEEEKQYAAISSQLLSQGGLCLLGPFHLFPAFRFSFCLWLKKPYNYCHLYLANVIHILLTYFVLQRSLAITSRF